MIEEAHDTPFPTTDPSIYTYPPSTICPVDIGLTQYHDPPLPYQPRAIEFAIRGARLPSRPQVSVHTRWMQLVLPYNDAKLPYKITDTGKLNHAPARKMTPK
jgi:hypothetical protein